MNHPSYGEVVLKQLSKNILISHLKSNAPHTSIKNKKYPFHWNPLLIISSQSNHKETAPYSE